MTNDIISGYARHTPEVVSAYLNTPACDLNCDWDPINSFCHLRSIANVPT
jgi:hypothetical protein